MSEEKKPAHEIVAEHIVKLTEENATLRAELDRLRGKGEPAAHIDELGHIQFTDRGTLKCGDKLYTHPAPQDAPHAEQTPMNDAIQTVIMEAVKRSGSATPQVEVDVNRAFKSIRPVYREPVPYLPCPKCGEKNVGVRVRVTAPQDDARDAERYRYIRDNAKDGAVKTLLPLYRAHYFVSLEPISECPTFDAAIDAAILASKVKP